MTSGQPIPETPAPDKSGTRMAVVLIRKGESDEQAVERHDREHPEDRGLSCVLVRYVDPKDGRPV